MDPIQQVQSTTVGKSAPYGMFGLYLILFTFSMAAGIFIIASAIAQGTPDALDNLMKGGGWFIGMIGMGYWANRTWSEIMRIETDPSFRQKHRSFALRAGIAVCGVLVFAAVYGSYLGIRAGHSAKLNLLTKQLGALGAKGAPTKQRFIQIARRETLTMPEYIQRCSELEVALNDSGNQEESKINNDVRNTGTPLLRGGWRRLCYVNPFL
jgi:hypothetical protein